MQKNISNRRTVNSQGRSSFTGCRTTELAMWTARPDRTSMSNDTQRQQRKAGRIAPSGHHAAIAHQPPRQKSGAAAQQQTWQRASKGQCYPTTRATAMTMPATARHEAQRSKSTPSQLTLQVQCQQMIFGLHSPRPRAHCCFAEHY